MSHRIPLSILVPGVRPDPYETLVYYVTSDSGEEPYRVDMTCFGGGGKCDCPDDRIRHWKDLEAGVILSFQTDCKHKYRVRRYMSFERVQEKIEEKMKLAYANKLRHPIGSQAAQDAAGKLGQRIPGSSVHPHTPGCEAIPPTHYEPDPNDVPW